MDMNNMYAQLGVSRAVYEYGEEVLRSLRDRFDRIDAVAEYNQAKVLSAMQKNRVNATHFAATTGYGYNDDGRDNLERVYAKLLVKVGDKVPKGTEIARIGSTGTATGNCLHFEVRYNGVAKNPLNYLP